MRANEIDDRCCDQTNPKLEAKAEAKAAKAAKPMKPESAGNQVSFLHLAWVLFSFGLGPVYFCPGSCLLLAWVLFTFGLPSTAGAIFKKSCRTKKI